MSDEKIFPDGLFFDKPRDGAPDFVKGKLGLNIPKFKEFVAQHADGDWMNFDLKESKGGKLYLQLNTWKPEPKKDNDNW